MLFSALLAWISLSEKSLFISSNFLYCSVVLDNSYSIGLESENEFPVSLLIFI